MVCEGRDMGTVVFPEAELKVYLIASTEVRARRRLEQQGIEPEPERVRAEIARLERRDRSDRERAVAPLRPAPDAELIDTTDLAFEDQVRQIVEMARKRLDMAEGSG
jgi:cytidylate kinase